MAKVKASVFGPGDKVTLNRDIVGSCPPTKDVREWFVVSVNPVTDVAVVMTQHGKLFDVVPVNVVVVTKVA